MGLENIHLFGQALVAKGMWRKMYHDGLWGKVVLEKYIAPYTIENWIGKESKNHSGALVIWKALMRNFPLVGK
jgi:hypothetical protein